MAHFLTTTILLVVAMLTADADVDGFVGGFSPAKVDDAEVVKMADFATTAVSANMNSGPVKLLKIVKAETQAVSGTNYKLNLELAGANSEVIPCEVVVFHQPKTNAKEMLRSSCSEVGGFSGGFFPLDVEDVKVKEMAAFATTDISANTNSGPVTLVKVVKAQFRFIFMDSQIQSRISGFNTELTLELNGDEGAIICEVTVFDQSWTNTRKLTESKCFPAKNALVKVAEAVHADTQVKTRK